MFHSGLRKASHGKKKGSTCFLNLVQEGCIGFFREFNFPSEVEKFKSLSNKHQNGFVIFFNASPFMVKTMMNQDHHEKKAGVTIKLCFNSKRILHINRTEGRGRWICDLLKGTDELKHFFIRTRWLFNFLRVVLFVQLIKWLHKISIIVQLLLLDEISSDF